MKKFLPHAKISTLSLALLSIATQTSAAGLTYLPSGNVAYGSNLNGSLVTGYTSTQNFIWSSGSGVTNIGGLNPNNNVGGTPRMDDAGTKVIMTNLNSLTSKTEMAQYDIATATWTTLGSLGSFSGTSASSGWGISNDGSTVVGLGWINAGSANAMYVVNGGAPQSLGTTVAGRSTRANAANQDGTIIAGWQDNSFGSRQGAIWNNGVQTLLFYGNTTDLCGEVGDINADGTMAVGATFTLSTGGRFAYRWTAATGGVSLGSVFDPSWSGAGTSISNVGTRVTGYYRGFGPALFGQGFLWVEGVGMISLNNLCTRLAIDTQTRTLALPLHMSGDGSTIVGQASGGPGFVLNLPSLIEGVVTLQNNDASATDETLTYVVKDPATGNTKQSGNATCFAGGGFLVENTAGVGTFDIYVKGTKWLQKKISGVQFGSIQARFSASLTNGDADQDNQVGPGDFELIVEKFGTTPIDAGWNANADLDDDGEVGPSDFEIVVNNFGIEGDN
jgi:hypothetical protein